MPCLIILGLISLLIGFMVGCVCLDTQCLPVKRVIGAGGCKIVESPFGHPYNMVLYKLGPFAGAILGMFKSTFPFQHRPSWKIILRKFTKNTFKINLPVA